MLYIRVLVKYIVLALGITMFVPLTTISAPIRSTAVSIQHVKHFLQRYLRDPLGFDTSTRIAVASVATKGSESKEFIVYVSGENWCGSGGCTLLVLTPVGASYKIIGRTTIVQLPIRILRSTTHGRPEIGVRVQGGIMEPGYEAILPFDGRRYPSNPSVPPARRSHNADIGKILIPTTEQGMRLYK